MEKQLVEANIPRIVQGIVGGTRISTRQLEENVIIEDLYDTYMRYITDGLSPDEAMKKLPDPIGGRIEYYEKFGYDTKFSSHLIRLLYSGLELLKEGELHLPLHKNNEILAIKNGEVTLEEVLNLADKLKDRMDNMKDITILPSKPDYDRINNLQIEIMEEYWAENN